MSETNRNRGGQGGRTTGRITSGRSAGSSSSGGTRKTSSQRQSSTDRIQAVQNARSRGGSTGSRSTGRTGSGSRKRGKHRRQGPDFAKILLILVGIVILVLCVAVGLKSCAKDVDSDAASIEETTTEPESQIEAEITINGISVNGLTKCEAKETIMEAINWTMTVEYGENKKELPNMIESKLDAVLTEAYETGEAGTYVVTADGLTDHVRAQVDNMAASWDVQPKNGSISSYDKETNDFVFAGAENGKLIDREKLTDDIMARIAAGDYQAVVMATANEVEPEITEAEAKANFKRLGTFSTTTTSNKDRNENIRIASAALNGMIIQPGETFSFNETTGNRTLEKGYKPAGAYQNGVLVEEPGGGVCQVSSTLYNAVVFSGLKTTERHAHSYEPSYVTPGEDAMVSYDGYSGPDMKFINNSKTAVGIKTSFSNQKLIISIYGNPILEEGVTLSMHSEKTQQLDPPKPEYVEDPYLEIGVEQEVKKATPGSRWVTNLVTKKDGEVVSDVLLHTSTYLGKAGTIKRNTSGTVLTTEAESTEASSFVSESESTAATEATESAETTPSPLGPGYNPGGPGAQQDSPGGIIESSAAAGNNEPGSGGPSGPGGNGQPQNSQPGGPGGNGGPGDSVTMPQNQPAGPAGQPETQNSPEEVGVISPIG